MTEHEALQKYAIDQDAEAFRWLVEQYQRLVYSAASRRLFRAEDIEDVVQLTFLKLAKAAGTIRRSLSVWLYTTTINSANDLIRRDQTRRRHEALAATSESITSDSERQEWHQLSLVLDEVLLELPVADQALIVEHFFCGRSQHDLAELLGVSQPTVMRRLKAAVQMLRDRLRFRGHGIEMPSLGLALSHLPQPVIPAAVTAELTKVGVAGVMPAFTPAPTFIAVVKIATAMGAMLAFVLCASRFWPISATPTTPAAPQRLAQAASAPAPSTRAAEDVEVVRVRGVVLDPDGKPANGATVSVAEPTNWITRYERKSVARATADAAGRFAIAFTKGDVAPFSLGDGWSGRDEWRHTQVVARAPGSGVAFAPWHMTNAAGDLELRLVRDDAPIRSRIVDEGGQPVAGVKIFVESITQKNESPRPPGEEDYPALAARTLLHVPFGGLSDPPAIVTDAEGRFRVDGVGCDRNVTLHAVHPRFAYARLEFVTRDVKTESRLEPQPAGFDIKYTTYGANAEVTLSPGHSVEGTITDAATKKPLAGVPVESTGFGSFIGIDPLALLKTVTDAEGHYRLDGFPPGEGRLVVKPTDDQPYFMRESNVVGPPGEEVERIDLELHRGVVVTGRVTDLKTGEPLPARMMYTTYLENPHTRDLPEFGKDEGISIDGLKSRYETRRDGSYRLVAAPGKAIIGVSCLIGGYSFGVGFDAIGVKRGSQFPSPVYQLAPNRRLTNAVREIDIPEGAEQATCDLQLDPGQHVRVNVVGPDGKPATGRLIARGQLSEQYHGPYYKPLDSPKFDAIGFAPDETRTIFVLDEAAKLGAAVPVDAAITEVEIKLEPLGEMTGRLVTRSGKPLANKQIDLRQSGRDGRTARYVSTDADGRFTLLAPVGVSYYLVIPSGDYAGEVLAEGLEPNPGANAGLGNLEVRAAP